MAGNPFSDVVHTLDITGGGARLGAIRRQLKIGSQLVVQFHQYRMEFRVVWTQMRACRKEHQIGVEALVARDVWGLAGSHSEQEGGAQPATGSRWTNSLPTLAKMLKLTAAASAK